MLLLASFCIDKFIFIVFLFCLIFIFSLLFIGFFVLFDVFLKVKKIHLKIHFLKILRIF